jgi:amino acid transporter
VRYSKFIAPLSVWCNWLAWTPVLAIGSGIAAGYVLNALFAPDAAIRTWEFQLADLGFMKEGLKLRLNSTFFIGAILLLISFAIQHRNILSTARAQTIVGVAVLLPLLIVGFVPLITGECGDAAFQLTPSRRLFATRANSAIPTPIPTRPSFTQELLCIAVYILVPLAFQGAPWAALE